MMTFTRSIVCTRRFTSLLFSTIKNDDSIVPALKSTSSQNSDGIIKRVMRLIDNIRQYGHLKADIYPVNPPKKETCT